jgi:hypothetical protein
MAVVTTVPSPTPIALPQTPLALSKLGIGAMATKLQHTEFSDYSLSLTLVIGLE